MYIRHPVLCLGVALLVNACADRSVVLRGATGSLSYDCEAIEPRATAGRMQALVREYAVLAVRDADQRGRLASADSIARAYDSGDDILLERAVVDYVCRYGDPRTARSPRFPEPGSLARDFRLPRLAIAADGTAEIESRSVRLGDLRGRVVVLNFWATWCLPCLEKHEQLARYVVQSPDPDVVVLGILHEDSPGNAARWLGSHGGIPYPFVVDAENVVGRLYGVTFLPRTFVVGPDGRIARRYIGPTHIDSLRALIASVRTPA